MGEKGEGFSETTNYKGHMEKTKGQWNQVREVGMARLRGKWGEKVEICAWTTIKFFKNEKKENDGVGNRMFNISNLLVTYVWGNCYLNGLWCIHHAIVSEDNTFGSAGPRRVQNEYISDSILWFQCWLPRP